MINGLEAAPLTNSSTNRNYNSLSLIKLAGKDDFLAEKATKRALESSKTDVAAEKDFVPPQQGHSCDFKTPRPYILFEPEGTSLVKLPSADRS